MQLGLPALTAVELRLLTLDGMNLMPNASKTFSLDVESDKKVM